MLIPGVRQTVAFSTTGTILVVASSTTGIELVVASSTTVMIALEGASSTTARVELVAALSTIKAGLAMASGTARRVPNSKTKVTASVMVVIRQASGRVVAMVASCSLVVAVVPFVDTEQTVAIRIATILRITVVASASREAFVVVNKRQAITRTKVASADHSFVKAITITTAFQDSQAEPIVEALWGLLPREAS